MSDGRPDPDALLARVASEEAASRRGRLKIFLGAAAGVGKTYAMLSAAQEMRAEGADVLVGLVETHGRAETAALLHGLEVLPPRIVEHRGARLREFDLDAALARRPALVIVDELAHSNAPQSRHPKRWNDVEELLDAGIDVYTAVNVQHLESLKDVVAGITGIQVMETVPDGVVDRADEVELVDLPPDELIERLKEGKVYLPQQAERAISHFFRKGNLIALRELALRRTAERVEAQMRDYRADQGIRDVWQAGERILVCIGPGPSAELLVRGGRRLAAALHAEWTVVYVETPRLQRLPPSARDAILENLRVAERLGASTATLSGPDIAAEIVEWARQQNVTRIVLGRPWRAGWRRWLSGSVVDAVVRDAREIEVHLIAPEPVRSDAGAAARLLARSRSYLGVDALAKRERKPRLSSYGWTLAIVAACSGLALPMAGRLDPVNIVMVYLAGVVFVAARFGRGPSVLASIAGVAAFDFLYVPPYLTFAVADTQYLLTFAVMLLVSLLVSNLTAGMRHQARVARYREGRMRSLNAMGRELASARTEDAIGRIAVRHVSQVFAAEAVVLLPDPAGRVAHPRAESIHGSLHGADLAVAQWVHDHGRPAGQGTDTLPAAEAHYLPLAGAVGPIGVLALLPANPRTVFVPEQHRLLETFAHQIVLALERVQLAAQARAAEVRAESERLRNALLSAISHDLRTPLAVIVGGLGTLLEHGERLDARRRQELGEAIMDEAQRMTGLVDNVLDMARLQSGAVRLRRQWHSLEEIVGSVLHRLEKRLADRPVDIRLPADLPLVLIDGVLVEQVLVNLVENAVKYTPAGARIEIDASARDGEVIVCVSDRGPGLPPGEEERVFEKFHRGPAETGPGGFGLGLAICRAIVEAHGGCIRARNRPGGGAEFTFVLPAVETPPQVAPEPIESAAP